MTNNASGSNIDWTSIVATLKASFAGKIVGVKPNRKSLFPQLPLHCPACNCQNPRWESRHKVQVVGTGKKRSRQNSYACHCGNTLYDGDAINGGSYTPSLAPPRCPQCKVAERIDTTIWAWSDCRTARCTYCNYTWEDRPPCQCQHCREERYNAEQQRKQDAAAQLPARRRPLGLDGLRPG